MALTKVGKEGITGISNSSDATAITIDSSENVTANANLTVTGNSTLNGKFLIDGSNNDLMTFRTTGDTASQVLGLQFQNNSEAVTAQIFGTGDNSSSGVFRIKGIGNVDIIGGDVGVTGASADLRVHSGGVVSIPNGVELGSGVDATSANILDDYEEGTWTPSVGGDTTYDNQIGRYVKIGNQVTLWFYIQINQRNSPGVPYIAGGSPFTNSSSITGSGLVHYFEGINNNAVNLTARIDPGGANINISGSTGSAATVANVNHDWVKNGADIYGFVTHYTG